MNTTRIIILTLCSFFLIQILFAQGTDCCPDVCDRITLYGDANDNIPKRIKHYDGFTYLIGSVKISNETFATFSKITANNQLVWEYRFDTQTDFLDFIKVGNEFLLVGRTLPLSSSNGFPVNNQSVMARIDDNGNAVYIRTYENNMREGFIRIIEHPNPINPNAPYYVSGVEGANSVPSYNDEVHLHNLDGSGNILWSVEFNAFKIDEQFTRDITPSSDGHILMIGNNLSPNQGMIIKVDGATGQVLLAKEETNGLIFNGVRELSNGNIVSSGFFLGNPRISALSLFDTDLTVLSSKTLSDVGDLYITSIDVDDNDNVYCANQLDNGQPIIIKASTTNNEILLTNSEYFLNGESDFSTATLFVDGSTLYYADSRMNNPASPGERDVFLGSFDLSLEDDCLIDAPIETAQLDFTLTDTNVSMFNFDLPQPTTSIGLVPIDYIIDPFCANPDCPAVIPTLSEWALIILALLLLILNVSMIRYHEETFVEKC